MPTASKTKATAASVTAGKPRPPRCRHDGWTVQRQLAFLEVYRRTRSAAAAARACGMSRESACRLRARDPQGLFAVMWDHLAAQPLRPSRRELVKDHISIIRRAFGPEGDGLHITPRTTTTS
jgi:hypothetical protein